jgi:hypothetical protein
MFPGLVWTGIFLTFLAPILALLTLASESRIPREPIGWLTAIVRLL